METVYSYSFLILLLPALSFVILALAGMKMSHKTAGLIGTTSLGLVTVLSYMTAFSYFTADRLSNGTFPTLVPYNFTWLPLGNLHFDMGILLDPISVMMLIVISTVSFMVHVLFIWLHAWREGLPALLRFPVAVYHVHAWIGAGYEYLPDVYLLGVSGRQLLFIDWILLSVEAGHCCL